MAKVTRTIGNEIKSCSDHSCIFGHPGGMGTNGGCQCEKKLRELGHELRMLFVQNIRAQRNRIKELEKALSEHGIKTTT